MTDLISFKSWPSIFTMLSPFFNVWWTTSRSFLPDVVTGTTKHPWLIECDPVLHFVPVFMESKVCILRKILPVFLSVTYNNFHLVTININNNINQEKKVLTQCYHSRNHRIHLLSPEEYPSEIQWLVELSLYSQRQTK